MAIAGKDKSLSHGAIQVISERLSEAGLNHAIESSDQQNVFVELSFGSVRDVETSGLVSAVQEVAAEYPDELAAIERAKDSEEQIVAISREAAVAVSLTGPVIESAMANAGNTPRVQAAVVAQVFSLTAEYLEKAYGVRAEVLLGAALDCVKFSKRVKARKRRGKQNGH